MTLSFYDNPDLEDGFNIWPHPWRTQGHRGLDFAKSTGTPIPSVNPGVVVISEWNKYLGWIVEVRGDDGVYVGYCHMHTQGLPVGTRVEVGTIIGPVGNTGSQSQGAHLHITKGDRQGAVRGASLSYLSDPWPYIAAAKTVPAPAEEEDEDDMWKPTVHLRVTLKGAFIEGTLAHPQIGLDLKPGEMRVEKTNAGEANVYRGYKASANEAVVAGWQAAYAKGPSTASSKGATDRQAYLNMQAAQQQMSIDLYGQNGKG